MDAQEMFKNSNKVTRPEKALILGFMAGSRGRFRLSVLSLTTLLKVSFRGQSHSNPICFFLQTTHALSKVMWLISDWQKLRKG